MKFSQRCKNIINKLRGKAIKPRDAQTDSEMSAEEVLEETIFPNGNRSDKKFHNVKTAAKARGKAPVRPTAKKTGTRPTNVQYKMIDPSDDTIDAGKS